MCICRDKFGWNQLTNVDKKKNETDPKLSLRVQKCLPLMKRLNSLRNKKTDPDYVNKYIFEKMSSLILL